MFSTRLVWNAGGGRWDVELLQIVDGCAVVLATVPLGDWAKLAATRQAILDAIEAGTTVKDLMAAR